MNKLLETRYGFKRKKSDKDYFFNFAKYKLSNFYKEIVSTQKKDIGFWTNELRKDFKDTHQISAFMIPCVAWIDIDFKRLEQMQNFKEDCVSPNKLINKLKEDENIWIVGRTLGGGIRVFGLVDSDYRLQQLDDHEIDGTSEMDDENIIKIVNQLINYKFKDYILKNYDLKEDRLYLDDCAERLSQPTFALKEDTLYYNNSCNNFFLKYNELVDKIEIKGNFTISTEDIIFRSEKNKELLFELCNINYKIFEPLFKTYNVKLIAMMRLSDEETRKVWFKLCNLLYKGSSMKKHLRTFDIFQKFLEDQKKLTSCMSLMTLLKKENIL